MRLEKIKVLIVDDSAVVRKLLTEVLSSDPQIEVIGTASDAFIAARKIQKQTPDVITLDVEMPRMDGITFLKRIMAQHPIPVIVISGLTEQGTERALEALSAGAIDVIAKPRLEEDGFSHTSSAIIELIKGASRAALTRRGSGYAADFPPAALPAPARHAKSVHEVIALGASTGGTDALLQVLEAMPADCPGIVIVQHMPAGFTRSFADRLNRICRVSVKEACDGQRIVRGQALIAPGDRHMRVKKDADGYYVSVFNGEPVNRHRPSVEVLFSSVAKSAGANAIGVIMTGMGSDGAKGLLDMRESGARTIAQDEKTCVVFGMPKEAIRLGAVEKVLSLSQIASWLLVNF